MACTVYDHIALGQLGFMAVILCFLSRKINYKPAGQLGPGAHRLRKRKGRWRGESEGYFLRTPAYKYGDVFTTQRGAVYDMVNF